MKSQADWTDSAGQPSLATQYGQRAMTTFTALNGGEQKPLGNPTGSPTRRSGSEERPSGPAPSGPEPKISNEVSSNQREHWSVPASERPPYQSAGYPEVDGTHKRKRSDSAEPRREAPNAPEERAAGHQSQPESRDAYGTPQRDRDYRPYGDEIREQSESWYSQQQREDRNAYDQQNSAGSMPSQTDEQIGDALRRATGEAYSPTSPDGDDYYGGSYTPEHRRDGSIIQSDPKKRKRNFSNRTKTGCLTCRKRKKKCDETKPECNNCLRGGFICQGYPNQRGYQKMENKSSAVPLESKDPSYIPPGAYGMPQSQAPYPNQPPAPPYRGQPLRIDPPQGRPVLTDDDRATASTIPTASVASPDNKLSAMSAYANAANVFPTPISAISSATTNFGEQRGLQKDYQRIPPLHDAGRNEPETPHPGSTLPQINILHPTRTSSPVTQPQTTSAQVAAQLALSHSHFPPARQPTQKELMLQGQMYRSFDKELVLERERCSGACWRFNNSTNPNTGVSSAERGRLFREILMPKDPINLSPSQQSPVSNIGRIGGECVVESPFTCDYGYNITIGQNVFIGRNCTIVDPCPIKIGNNVYIGPNVSLFAATLQTDPSKRMGSKSLQMGSTIFIDDDAWIGGGVIILPGRRVGKGATVAAGSIVTRVSFHDFSFGNMPANQIFRTSHPLPSWAATLLA
ncbi:uncharacterized protein BCR38DRAFT_59325 [Pseudomassariella vexata]|uniref:Zn(2)-C6 fungal-type domain-containing protein n=1 Tax=Pseudomassariella vexata TaxID=1141098 RepID=A0A1Y2DK72_9PEZI|nr:uncharacterized protein BCR38DRAFT_59325 [Pseudomassariella vexata]ORY59564.1 hypothetical protein BCR38DRAFT_59325 [Pseudomassariella vexata]